MRMLGVARQARFASPACSSLQQPEACPVLQSESRGQAAAAKAAATPLGSALLLLLPPPDRANSN